MPKGDAPASVIDASALLALLQDENGADEVVEAIAAGAAISTVNLSEVLAKLAEHGQPAVVALGSIHEAAEGALRIEPFTEDDAAQAADLRPRSKAQKDFPLATAPAWPSPLASRHPRSLLIGTGATCLTWASRSS